MLKKAKSEDIFTSPSSDADSHSEALSESRDLGDLLKLEPTPFDQSLISNASAQEEIVPQPHPIPSKTSPEMPPKPHLKDHRRHRDGPLRRTPQTLPDPVSSPRSQPALWMVKPYGHKGVLETFRLLKNRVSHFKAEENIGTILFTGAGPEVGVSTTVFNFGLVLARDLPNLRILIVELNIQRPALADTFRISATPGVLNHLLDQIPWQETVSASFLPNLDLIPLGSTRETVFSPYDLPSYAAFIDAVGRAYDYVLFDSEPVLQSSQTRIASGKTDGVILVAQAHKTRWQVVAAAKRQLAVDGVKLLGSFLNKRQFVIPRWLYRFI